MTSLLTVIFDLIIAIEIGLLLAVMVFLRRAMENTTVRVYGEQLLVEKPMVRIIRMRKMPFIDATGIHNLLR